MKNYNILNILKHRYPFLMIDKIIDVTPNEESIVLKNISYNESWTNGHFPNNPIFPGVLMIEAMAQASSVIFCQEISSDVDVYLAQTKDVKLLVPVKPGDIIIFKSNLISVIDKFITVKSEAFVDEKKVATGILVLVKVLSIEE